MEFESFNEGTLLHIGIQEGETAKVDTLLAIIGEEGEDISSLLNGSAEAEKSDATPEEHLANSNEDIEMASTNAQEFQKELS